MEKTLFHITDKFEKLFDRGEGIVQTYTQPNQASRYSLNLDRLLKPKNYLTK